MDITTKYIKILENKTDHNNNLRISVYYDLGGYNLGTGREKPRGYYISVQPVNYSVKNGLISEEFTAFTGYYDFLEPATRRSKKAEAAALEKAASRGKILINYITNKNGYILEG